MMFKASKRPRGSVLFTYLAVIVNLAFFSCGEPTPPSTGVWEVFAVLPYGWYETVAVCTDIHPPAVYAAVTPRRFEQKYPDEIIFPLGGSRIYRYDYTSKDFVEVYESPLGVDAYINDVAISKFDYNNGLYGWAAGVKSTLAFAERKPLLIRYDGKKWYEVSWKAEFPLLYGFGEVKPIDDDECWLLAKLYGPMFLMPSALYKYAAGDLTSYPMLENTYGVFYENSRDLTWVGTGGEDRGVYISPDRGQTWVKETPDEAIPGYDLQYCWPVWVEGDAVYFCAAYTRDAYGCLLYTSPSPRDS